MQDSAWHNQQATLTLGRLWPRIAPIFTSSKDAEIFHIRLETHFPTTFRLLHELYGNRYDFFYHLEEIVCSAARSCNDRSRNLKDLDQQREATPQWFQEADTQARSGR